MSNLKLLQDIFGRRLVVTVDEAAPLLGWHPQSIRNSIAGGRWQIRVRRLGGRLCMSLVDIAAWLDDNQAAGGQAAAEPSVAARAPRPQLHNLASQPEQQKRKPGRPKKCPGLGEGG